MSLKTSAQGSEVHGAVLCKHLAVWWGCPMQAGASSGEGTG